MRTLKRILITLMLPAILAVACTSSAAAQIKNVVKLPIEIMGGAGTQEQVKVVVPAGLGASVTHLWVKAHNLGYANKASIQVNSGDWTMIANGTVDVAEPGKSMGGIGGAYATIHFKLTIPGGVVSDGINHVRFRFTGTDGISSGYRILEFNFLKADGTKVIPADNFEYEDPTRWKPFYSSAAKIAEGSDLWHNATLQNSPLVHTPLKVGCSDCHAHNATDLKYFGYSDRSIVARAMFHGLTQEQGREIASYVRSNASAVVGRPWNPPYQPGPGLDAKPVSEWAAGAGLEWALDNDEDTLDYLFPNGITESAVLASGSLSVRQIPIGLQLPDWNAWLPRIHPLDAWGSEWESSEVLKRYDGEGTNTSYAGKTLRERFGNTSQLTSYLSSPQAKAEFNTWQLRRYQFLQPKIEGNITWTSDLADKAYSTLQWQLVKSWEMFEEFHIEGLSRNYFGQQGENRSWLGQIPFNVAPFMLNVPDNIGIHSSALLSNYLSNAWYHVQLVVNPGNKVGQGTSPIDWGYTWGKFKDFYAVSGRGELGRYAVFFAKGMQEWNQNGLDQTKGWNPNNKVTIDFPFKTVPSQQWGANDPTKRGKVFDALIRAWLIKARTFTPQEYYDKNLASASYVPVSNQNGNLGDRYKFTMGALTAQGVSATVRTEFADWCRTLWPLGTWP